MSLYSNSDCGDELNPSCKDALKLHLGHFTPAKEPLRVLICGGAGQVAYSLLHPLISGHIFGSHQNVIVHLLDIEAMLPAMHSISKEMMNCCSTLLKGIVKTFDLKVAFTDVDVVIMLASIPVKKEQSSVEPLQSMTRLSREYGQAIDTYAKKTVKVLVVSDPCHLVVTIMSRHASSIPPLNFSFLMRLDLNRTVGHISHKAGLSNRCVRKLIVWGETGRNAVVDSAHCELLVHGQWEKAAAVLNDEGCVGRNLAKIIVERTVKIQAIRPLACALSTASAICDHLQDWFFGTKLDQWTCMGVVSDGSYGVEPGIFYGFPTVIDVHGSYRIVEGLSIDPAMRVDLRKISRVLMTQRKDIIAIDDALPAI